ncbi:MULTISPECIES: non-hydrolyzing UDP-N-acetylglucosamine 2-epimerase [Caproicibacterium]|jgi:UDP-N-acetylglucosamine 2-epimerase (non-hydrolysing)/UDP-GlcNAc3NAcA epimerase|uniref:UDP-N-acetylglucosamine 2-epimerase (Non-hydrolyzing) n=1 Tax=Caproicibacterium lactatifermentans TaxID=2666138 RepID=A0A859DRL7_9FIRM|nr:UDP-N-acetylglucosamine 2-epimerase (non-hydrolyzing) [Caproicibacterium lactatifermentans]ARP50840.1 UDP-N-acetylglucosamine 2-epimerase (non-hydrolyzing) [Ruminococcaceae bacterium CPB6]MDD4808187.1 UDP-N-acetylglucosamine 2-epimerase (non-hydrolyzing) [Oscillospiraceae bacterium]QKN23432.1 UDP-N-acetylglucosamine 2-epimerase (non-hydrolyzing) [Caproicibacterium lactatifermentans]QKO29890.1 UDP-N-acetylglucosamine 2-epimerase (non-hydrolyzing) [Caproicibacterium lactatifermentans]
MKVVTVVGARPQFIKASVVSAALAPLCQEVLVHTGQHYDKNMSAVFFEELQIPHPAYNLGVGSGTHGRQTGEMLIGIEQVLFKEKPDVMLVYGDTNSTLAGALAASKLHIPVAHVEAGLRSYNRRMPEEQNRVLTDHISTQLFCPTQTAWQNLQKEGITEGVSVSGDVMLDSVLHFRKVAMDNPEKRKIHEQLGIEPKHYRLATLHRAETTDGGLPAIERIFDAFEQLPQRVVIPIHPRTRSLAEQALADRGYRNIQLIDPVGYLEMLLLTNGACQVLTDSGGLQKEAWFMEVPCVTLRSETEWVETLVGGWNVLAKLTTEDILSKALNTVPDPAARAAQPFGDGHASERIARAVCGREG